MPSDPARSPLGRKHVCSVPGCSRPSCFQVHLETDGGAPPHRTGDSCGTHLTDVVQSLACRGRRRPGRPDESAQIVVYATPEGGHADENGQPGPFDRFPLGVIPI